MSTNVDITESIEHVEKKFGINLGDAAEMNFYANYSVETGELTCEYIISKSDSCMAYAYEPTETEVQLIEEMMEDACFEMYGCSLYDCQGVRHSRCCKACNQKIVMVGI